MSNADDWILRSDLNWCYNCWFGARIESKKTRIGIMYICRCGFNVHIHDDEEKDTNPEQPPFFKDDNEWSAYWEKHFKHNEGITL